MAVTGWPTKDIVYTTIVGLVMVAALLEWFLWLGVFVFCLGKCFVKAETRSTKVLSVVMIVLFASTRAIFLPIMLVTLPLPARIARQFPEDMVVALQWLAFWSFSALLIVPWLFCIYTLVTNNIGRHQRIKGGLNEISAPKVVIVMPCYNELPPVLMKAIDSIVDGDYPPSCLHIFLSFDGEEENALYMNTIRSLGVPPISRGLPASLDICYRGTRITVSRFKHGGKRKVQKRSFQLIDKIYKEYLRHNDNLFILFIDSDCILDKVCIQNFIWEMELRPGAEERNMLAMTGVITSTAEKITLITLLQDMEYLHGQLFERSVESCCGAVTCLPGALTILRFSAFRSMAKFYFAEQADHQLDGFDYGKCHLGEDRWLTHLFMVGARKPYQIAMSTGAFCKTEAVKTYSSLIKQRRRWFIGFITNESCMLTDIRLWRRYPILCIVRFMQNTIRTTALLFFIMVVSLLSTTQTINQLPVGFIAVSLGLNWLLMVYFGFRLHRYKCLLYPLMFVVNPFFNWLYLFHGVITFNDRTWGGPRADAEKQMDRVPESEGLVNGDSEQNDVHLQPSTNIEGRFANPERDECGFFDFSDASLPSLSVAGTPNGDYRHQRHSSMSNYSDYSMYSTGEPPFLSIHPHSPPLRFADRVSSLPSSPIHMNSLPLRFAGRVSSLHTSPNHQLAEHSDGSYLPTTSASPVYGYNRALSASPTILHRATVFEMPEDASNDARSYDDGERQDVKDQATADIADQIPQPFSSNMPQPSVSPLVVPQSSYLTVPRDIHRLQKKRPGLVKGVRNSLYLTRSGQAKPGVGCDGGE